MGMVCACMRIGGFGKSLRLVIKLGLGAINILKMIVSMSLPTV